MKQEFRVTCPFCAVGCRFKILKGENEVVFSQRTTDNIDFDYENDINEGALCPRGHFAYELLSHPKRLGRAFYKKNGKLTPEIPEIIFQKVVADLKKQKAANPLAILFDPMLSLHDIRALLEFARNNKITTVDFVAPTDWHLFHAMVETPFTHRQCRNSRALKNLNSVLAIGDLFTKEPVLSRHLLKAKYAFRANQFNVINPFPTRTSWFADTSIVNSPHSEPLLLTFLFHVIFKKIKLEEQNSELSWLDSFIEEKFRPAFETLLNDAEKQSVIKIADHILNARNAAIFYSTHLYNSAGSYISALVGSAISAATNCYFIPLYTDGNLSAVEDLASNIFPELQIGRLPTLQRILAGKYRYLWAAGWNPATAIPGRVNWPGQSDWIVSSMVQGDFPETTKALLPLAHLYEQMDLRTNFVAFQSQGSELVKQPIGAAQSLSHFTFLFHQKIIEEKVSFEGGTLARAEENWQRNLRAETDYYLTKLNELNQKKGVWFLPADHVTQYKDGFLTRHARWAQKDCVDEQLSIAQSLAEELNFQPKQYFNITVNKDRAMFKTNLVKNMPAHLVTAYSHYPPARRMMEGEFANHNNAYYFWCPKITLSARKK
ncbi:MAG TPA: hypothetical protein ENK14_00110 [Caldithrix sp.]|nr:hypothetical protein [Caldithrix sp.]